MAEKVYLIRKSYIVGLALLVVFLFAFFLFWFLLSLVPDIQPLAYAFLAMAIVMPPIATLARVEKIVFDKEGVTFKRPLRPIILKAITDLEVRMSRGKEIGLKVVGLAPDGKRIRTIRIMREGDVDKRWEEFKKDLQKIRSK